MIKLQKVLSLHHAILNVRGAPDRFDPSAYANVAHELSDEPQSVIEVMQRADSELWTASMNDELAALAEKQVYSWSDLPQGK
jgi:hypothetical protein